MSVLGRDVRVLLDTGAAVNAVTEEFVVGLLNCAARRGATARDPEFPILQMEKWAQKEKVSGVAKDTPVHLVGTVVLRVRLGAVGQRTAPEVPIRFKIVGAGTCDWHGFILGGRTLDTTTKGGLGLRATPDAHVLEGPGVVLPRCEEGGYERPDEAYGMRLLRVTSAAPSLTLRSVFDSESDTDSDVKEKSARHVGSLVFGGDAMIWRLMKARGSQCSVCRWPEWRRSWPVT